MILPVVGVNLLWLVPGVVGGREETTLRLLRAIDRLDPTDVWIRLYAQPELAAAHPDLLDRFEVATSPRPLTSKVSRIAAEHSWLAAAARSDDLVHHAGGVVPALTGPSVVTIHDLQPFDMPDQVSVARRRWLTAMLPRSTRMSRRVVVPSRFTADRVEELLAVPRERLAIVPFGHERTEPGVLDDVQHQQHLDRFGRYLLLPAIAYAHKRHVDLVDALDLLRDRFPDLSVVMTGGEGPETERVLARVAELTLDDRWHYLGRVDESLLDSLYRSAAALAFPSAYEGFGNPVLEAMARGCPVVAAASSSIPELVGDAALLVDPERPRALAAAIARVLSEPELAERLSMMGVEQARSFGWRNAAVALVAAYRDALR